jgi:O-acetyl-ADP-ribose deacetylase (regulator of RNase III)
MTLYASSSTHPKLSPALIVHTVHSTWRYGSKQVGYFTSAKVDAFSKVFLTSRIYAKYRSIIILPNYVIRLSCHYIIPPN